MPLHSWHTESARILQKAAYNGAVMRPETRHSVHTVESPKSRQVHRTPPHNLGVLELIRAKRERSWKPSVEELRRGFRGWHQRGYLPHFDAPHVTQFVTFLLAGSFPVTRRAEWEPIFKEKDDSTKRKKLEAWLDRGYGECWLRQTEVAKVVEQVLLEADGRDYRLHSWVVMPNHVHLVMDVWDVSLAKRVSGWKGKSSRFANLLIQRRGEFWQEDYFDTLIRDEAHLKRAIRYVELNPVKACLVKESRGWPWSSAPRRDEYERLPWQRQA